MLFETIWHTLGDNIGTRFASHWSPTARKYCDDEYIIELRYVCKNL